MANVVHYEEDAFLLKEMLKTLRRGCSINIDSSIFLEYAVNQILFINKALKELYASISESVHIKPPEQIRNLLRVSTLFTDLIDDLLNDRIRFSEYTRSYISDFTSIENEHLDASEKLREILADAGITGENEELVSQEEFMFLFREEEEDSPE